MCHFRDTVKGKKKKPVAGKPSCFPDAGSQPSEAAPPFLSGDGRFWETAWRINGFPNRSSRHFDICPMNITCRDSVGYFRTNRCRHSPYCPGVAGCNMPKGNFHDCSGRRPVIIYAISTAALAAIRCSLRLLSVPAAASVFHMAIFANGTGRLRRGCQKVVSFRKRFDIHPYRPGMCDECLMGHSSDNGQPGIRYHFAGIVIVSGNAFLPVSPAMTGTGCRME